MRKIFDNLKRGFIFTVTLPFKIVWAVLTAPFLFFAWQRDVDAIFKEERDKEQVVYIPNLKSRLIRLVKKWEDGFGFGLQDSETKNGAKEFVSNIIKEIQELQVEPTVEQVTTLIIYKDFWNNGNSWQLNKRNQLITASQKEIECWESTKKEVSYINDVYKREGTSINLIVN